MSNKGCYEDAINLTAFEADDEQLKHSDIRIVELGGLRVVGGASSPLHQHPFKTTRPLGDD